MNKQIDTTPGERDGGYYAIKGFLYQFDITLLEILRNPEKKVQFEQIQDINYDNYVIQVKHKETQSYSDSKIRAPIIQLLDIFIKDNNKKLNLYCHFKDQLPCIKSLKLSELDNILGDEKSEYKRNLKSHFIKNFRLIFANDFKTQFIELIDLIKKLYTKNDQVPAVYYHSIFRSKLLDLSIKEKSMREINKINLDGYITNVKKVIFHSSYSEYLTKEQYEKLIKKEFFTNKGVNISNFERLFVIEANENDHIVDIQKIIHAIMSKYYRRNKSPAPFICISSMTSENLNLLKQSLIDQKIYFIDGTFFNGDKFRIDMIMNRDENVPVKIINTENLQELLSNKQFNEIFQFHKNNPVTINAGSSTKQIHIFIEDAIQILKMIS